MKEVALSIDELIYCFYSEGYYEQGNSLRQIFFDDLNEEELQLILQSATRSLLARDLIHYINGKFHLIEEMKKIVLSLNSAEKTIRAAKHDADNDEIAMSFHLTDDGFVKQSSIHDDLVHTFQILSEKDMLEQLSDFFNISENENGSSQNDSFSISEEGFEELLVSLEEKTKSVEQFESIQQPFVRHLIEHDLEFNTLMFFRYNNNNEPIAEAITLITNSEENNWLVDKKDDMLHIQRSNKQLLHNLVNVRLPINFTK